MSDLPFDQPSADWDENSRAFRQERPDSTTTMLSSAWELDSLLLFAEHTRSMLLNHAKNNDNQTYELLAKLIEKYMKRVQSYYAQGINILLEDEKNAFYPVNFDGNSHIDSQFKPYERGGIIRRVGHEWSLLMGMVASSMLLDASHPAIKAINTVIDAAIANLELPKSFKIAVLPHFGRHFELVKFPYAADIVVLGIPVTSLYCPWDWTLIWHEVAGIYIQTNQALPIISAVQKTLETVVVGEHWQTTYQPLVTPLLQDGQLPIEVLNNWAEELIEDSVSVLCLGSGMVRSLELILARHYPTEGLAIQELDYRHPPRELRIAVASNVAQLMGLHQPERVDESAQVIAKAIVNHASKIVHQPFSAADATLVQQAIQHIQAGSMAALSAYPAAHVLIATATEAIYGQHTTGNAIRQFVYGDTTSFAYSAPENLEATTLDELDRMLVSHIDAAVSVRNHSHPGGGFAMATVEFSGVPAHGQGHQGSFVLMHKH